MSDPRLVLQALDFGQVDSESQPELGATFVRTADFDEFVSQRHDLVRGPKGSGKSALFQLFARHEETAVKLAGGRLEKVLIQTATGVRHTPQVSTDDLKSMEAAGLDAERLWLSYLALKAAAGVAASQLKPRGILKRYIRAAGLRPDRRVAPIAKRLWRSTVSDHVPLVHNVEALGFGLQVAGQDAPIGPVEVLREVNALLEGAGLRLWLLFDNLDELFANDAAKRASVISALFAACNQLRGTYPLIEPKIFIRSDIWGGLQFTNKSHWAGKDIDLTWNEHQLLALVLKRAISNAPVMEVLREVVPELDGPEEVDDLTHAERLRARDRIWQAEFSNDKWATWDWMLSRAADGRFGPLPREVITFASQSRRLQLLSNFDAEGSLIAARAVREAYPTMSRIRCETFLSEFPELAKHFDRFRGQTSATFHRAELERVMTGLQPHGQLMIDALVDVGVIEPSGGDISSAKQFEVPLLYRPGLGLRLRGRR